MAVRANDTFRFVLSQVAREPLRPLVPPPPLIQWSDRADAEPLPISVLIPAHNRADAVQGALDSVASQHPRPPAEVIVVDDGSTDSTSEVAEEAGARVARHQRNMGASAARGTGLSIATQPWIALLDSDDRWLPHHLATLWAHRHGHVLVAGSALRCHPGSDRGRFHGPPGGRIMVLRTPRFLIFPANFICTSTVLMRRSALEALGGFREDRVLDRALAEELDHPVLAEDLDLWIRLLGLGSGLLLPIVTTRYEIHDEQSSGNRGIMQEAHLAAAREHSDQSWWAAADLERWIAAAGWDNIRVAIRSGQYRRALREARALTTSRQRLLGVVGTWLWRFLVRRRSSEVDADGRPSIAVLPNRWAVPQLAGASQRRRLNVSYHSSAIRGYLALLRRPNGLVIIGSRSQALLARLLRIRACSSPRQLSGWLSWTDGEAGPDEPPVQRDPSRGLRDLVARG